MMRVLLVEDNPADARLTFELLRHAEPEPVELVHAGRLSEAIPCLAAGVFDAVLLDLGLPDSQGLDTLTALLEAEPDMAVVVATGLADQALAIEAVRLGAQDFVVKGRWSGEMLARVLRYGVERLRTQRRLRDSERLLESRLLEAGKMEAVGQLAGGIAHDFNNLLNLILGYGDLLASELGPGHPGSARLEQIRVAGLRAAELTRQLLAFSRKQVLTPTVLDLNEQLRHLDRLLRPLIGESIELVALPGPDSAAVTVDPGQLEQVIVNLAVNAQDAMPRGGRLVLETSIVFLDDEASRRHPGAFRGPYVQLAITDSGHGMDEATLSRVFEPFFTTKEAGRGTGLGLATVYGVVHQSGGLVEVTSELGRGTTFRVLLPRVEPKQVSAPTPREAPPPRGSETVLVAEDTAALRRLIGEILRKAGYTVLEAEDPVEAQALAARLDGKLDCLLTDVMMPGMSGPELADRLRQTSQGLQVVFVSGYADDAIGRQALTAEGAFFLQKPFSSNDLLLTLRQALDSRAALTA